ncbi:hypothetical protein KFU94_37600 [Chloroflexi bacterium TSY]|nr:hypothetical protein [Chloroflexi bacterium TSY]
MAFAHLHRRWTGRGGPAGPGTDPLRPGRGRSRRALGRRGLDLPELGQCIAQCRPA